MGFIHANMIPILKEHRARPFGGRLLLLGQGDIYFSLETFERMAKSAGLALNGEVPFKPSHIAAFAEKGYPHSDVVFRKLGFSSINVLDYSAFEGADIVHDLNSAALPEELRGAFDVVIDHGTLEHVFHFPNALNNLFQLLKVGGRAVISAPSGNFFDHGFYMFQPTLFLDFFAANDWTLNSIQVAQYTPDQETEPAFFTDYVPGMFSAVSYGGLDSKLYTTQCIATKTAASTGDRIPQQGAYARMQGWASPAEAAASAQAGGRGLRHMIGRAIDRLKR
jgi:SAM-dependent methyltransferase